MESAVVGMGTAVAVGEAAGAEAGEVAVADHGGPKPAVGAERISGRSLARAATRVHGRSTFEYKQVRQAADSCSRQTRVCATPAQS